jgi:poly-gamma-glutamate synthesis protein (capsule biosynthesis protein)
VIVLVRAGLDQAELPLPEWRARYRRWVDVGASVVVDTGSAKGWEVYKNGLIFYGLGAPNSADSLGLFLTLRRNSRLDYEARALQCAAGQIDYSVNDAFKQRIDAQNRLFTDEKAYLKKADEMCRTLYCELESTQKRGVLGLFSSHADEETKLLALLENESLRLVTRRGIRVKQAAEKEK